MPRKRKPPNRKRLPNTRRSVTHKVTITDTTAGSIDVYITVGFYADGSPGELFIRVGKWGSTLHGLLDVIGIETSLLLQFGVPLHQIASKLRGMKFVPEGATDNPDVASCLSLVDYIFTWLEREYVS
ncbi:hypothetical protein LCGC14_1131730 [marine sediment metagenome]|uniref:ribonucleoside-diphosphate reductase n=1 Tax=marine sediment metagenome TaxID=412755 RepID=A0A0F9M0U6_9ZZZZ